MDHLDKIISYEQNELSFNETVTLFQELLDSGLVWDLQGHYGRMSEALIKDGYILERVKSN
jgi:hypothetical protein